MTYSEAKSYLDSFINFESNLQNIPSHEFKLNRVKFLLEALGNPQNDCRVIHVAGSKGKGSTAALMANILKSANLRVGLYTSPHLINYRERIRLCSLDKNVSNEMFPDAISESELALLVEETKESIEKVKQSIQERITFYEVYTALAFYFFKQQKADYVVLETGLGGRLDATNACESLLAVLTPISLEHTHILGDTIAKIASEKAGIIKNANQKVVVAAQSQESEDVFIKRCDNFDIEPICVGKEAQIEDYKIEKGKARFNISFADETHVDLESNLLGFHQAQNAATAICAIKVLMEDDERIKEKHIIDGIDNVFWPGRFEIIGNIIFDCAHNQASAHELVKTFQMCYPSQKAKVVLGLSEGKDYKGICDELNKIADEIIFTQANHPRSVQLNENELQKYFSTQPIVIADDSKKAMDKIDKDELVLITGSVFVVSEVREQCINLKD